MEIPARLPRRLILLCLLCLGWVARGQENSVTVDLTSLNIQGEVNQVRNSSFSVNAAPAYNFLISGNVHGVGPLFSQLVPTSEPAVQAFESIHKGLSSVLQGSVADAGSALPATILNEAVSSGTDGLFNAMFSISLDSAGLVTFAVTNVAIEDDGQPDTSDQLVFDSGNVQITALFPDVSTMTLTATNVKPNSAYLTSSVICQNSFEAWFNYSADTSLSSTSSMVSLGPKSIAQNVSIPVTGLLAHHLYHFRAVAADITGPSYGTEQTFVTADTPPVAGAVTAFAGITPTTIRVLANCSDADGDKLRVMSVSNGKHGKGMVVGSGKAVSYQFTSGTAASDQFSYTIADGYGGTAVGEVTVMNYGALAGSYTALLLDAGLNNAVTGYLRIELAATGVCTGQLVLGGKMHRFTGELDYNGHLWVTLGPTNPNGVDVTLTMNEAGGQYILDASVSVNGQQQTGSLPRQARGMEGTYTLVMPPPAGSSYLGAGYGVVEIGATGLARVTGALADGEAFSCATVAGSNGALGVYSALYAAGNPGSLSGNLVITGEGPALISGTLLWTKPALANAPINQGPFSIELMAEGASYVAPVGEPALKFGTSYNVGEVELSGQNLSPPVELGIKISSSNLVSFLGLGDPHLSMIIHTGNGLFSGQLIDPVTGYAHLVHGALIESSTSGAGYFLGGATSGEVDIGP